jgi:isopentenyl diphosphate isomerase/L-lactate dehydrogenase-like FMN-dependent dehydrogenase
MSDLAFASGSALTPPTAELKSAMLLSGVAQVTALNREHLVLRNA